MDTQYHAKYFAHELLKRSAGNSIGKLSQSIFNAQVDLNPHQVEAALFAFKSPLSKGIILADEVGLGKTIEAGLILSQYWAEQKRNILIICPASLRKQWSQELEDKFNISSIILEAKNFKQAIKDGTENPFCQKNKVIITSFNFASRKKEDIIIAKWNISIIDEAHKLRNAYRPSNKTGQNIKFALKDTKKILLTATPMQNSLMELYGLSTLIDEYFFGDAKSFRQSYTNVGGDLNGLQNRLKSFCKRTLRDDVKEYVSYTNRNLITESFKPDDEEHEFYSDMSKFLLNEDTYSIPKKQRALVTLMLRKLLASSTYAILGTLENIKKRLEKLKDGLIKKEESLNIDFLIDDPDFEDIIAEDSEDYNSDRDIVEEEKESEELKINITQIKEEIEIIEGFIKKARNIKTDTKTKSLLKALDKGFKEMRKAKAAKKALLFTESRRTQDYLFEFLSENGYKDKIVLFNGSNSDSKSKEIYKAWLNENKQTGKISGSRTADKRASLVDSFKNDAEIMIATEAAAEGINLQFCSLLINYDLPWNPQRVEQRIGRCHRYGQKNDVVVINFLNKRNEADQRIYTLLKDKFNLFNGVFGASDEVINAANSGVGFERKILNIFQKCRTQDEITLEFKKLQKELEDQINSKMDDAKKILIDNFDEEVHSKLKIQIDETVAALDKTHKLFWAITKHQLKGSANFNDSDFSFDLKNKFNSEIPKGKYKLMSKKWKKELIENGYVYRLSHPLGEKVTAEALELHTPHKKLIFNISDYPKKITVVENLKGKSGYMILSKLTINSFEDEDFLLFNAFTNDGKKVEHEVCEKMFSCNAELERSVISEEIREKLLKESEIHAEAVKNRSLDANNQHYREESNRLDKWAEDMELSADRELTDKKAVIKAAKRELRYAESTEEQLTIQKKVQKLERERKKLQQKIFLVSDEIYEKRDQMIEKLRKRMTQTVKQKTIFQIEWSVK